MDREVRYQSHTKSLEYFSYRVRAVFPGYNKQKQHKENLVAHSALKRNKFHEDTYDQGSYAQYHFLGKYWLDWVPSSFWSLELCVFTCFNNL